jgi:hypothetical protein
VIALRKPTREEADSTTWQEQFTKLLPAIRQQAGFAFRGMGPEARADAVAEVVAHACCAFARLVELGKADIAYPRALARFGVKRFLDGRRTGSQLNINDVLSPYAQKRKGIAVTSLDRFDEEEGVWREAVVEDDQTPVPDQAAFRIDFPAWLQSYPLRDRCIAEALAVGERTKDVAAKFGVSPGRVSQLRRRFYEDWQTLHGENARSAAVAALS